MEAVSAAVVRMLEVLGDELQALVAAGNLECVAGLAGPVVWLPGGVVCAPVVAIGRWGGSGSLARMEGTVGDLRSRAVRLRRKHLGDLLWVGLHIAILGGASKTMDPSGDLSLMEIYAFVGPGALAWSVTGRGGYGSLACALYLAAVALFGGVWLASWVSVIAFFGLGSVAWCVGAGRAGGWTWRGMFRSVLVKTGEWLEIEVREVEPVVEGVADRPNTGSETVVMAVVWVVVVSLSVGMGIFLGTPVSRFGWS